ncbi:hypothetical protein CK203_047555 [Vitis vinifera]|uniref:Uncharacterized protein n=1 Tax=Vitis vinifera TaxID=29760 RepID=A0A438GX09_VITVI|nr:hypothetical protein CK203_047555 [Vitis vinifera]
MATKKIFSTSRASEVHEKVTDKLDAKEFRERFCIPNSVAIELLNGRVLVPTDKSEERTIIFSKEQFNAGLRFPLPALFKEFLHFTQIPPVFIHPNIVWHVHTPALPSIGDGAARFNKGRGDGTRGGPGAWVGFLEHPARPFSPNYSLVVPGPELRGHLVDWVEKASFACLSKLFEINAKERQCKTLLTAQNLMAVVREPREYVINILPRKMPKEVVPGEHYTVKDLPIYEALKEADAEKRRALLDNREKKKNEGTLRKAPGQKRDADSPSKENSSKKEEAGEEWEGSEGAHSSYGICSSAHYSRGGGNDRGASEPRSSFYLERVRIHRGAESLKHLFGSGCSSGEFG